MSELVAQQHVPLPDIQVVPTDTILPHEALDASRAAPLAERIEHDGYLANPLLVTRHNTHYVLLDGTNRLNALRELAILSALVQIVDYQNPLVTLATWHHILTHESENTLLDRLHSLSEIVIKPNTEEEQTVATLRLASGKVYLLDTPGESLVERATALQKLVSSNIEHTHVYRTVETEIKQVQTRYQAFTGLMQFSSLSKHDVMTMASKQILAPAGVTRHIVQGRALRLNYPLSALRGTTVTAANERLQQWLKQRYSERGIRFYSESAYLFDE